MKRYAILITDAYASGEIHVAALNKTAARAEARLYIKQWGLQRAKIGYIREEAKSLFESI